LGRLIECLPHVRGLDSKPSAIDASRALLAYALSGEGEPGLGKTKIGMFAPSLSGMPNSWSVSQDATNASLLNPWDFVLMLEGAALFGGSVARSLSEQQAVFPFTTTAGGVDRSGRSMAGEDARGETWLPLWGAPVSLPALRRLVSEGRVQDGRNQARSGRAMGRATSTLGVDRGIDAFERVVYAGRFGRNYVAVPIDRVRVRASQQVDLLREADGWLRRARALGGNDIRACAAAVDRSAYETALGEAGAFERWVAAMGAFELAVARAAAADSDTKARPLQGLSARMARELEACPEVRLAVSLARVLTEPDARGGGAPAVRVALEPVRRQASGRVGWFGRGGTGEAGLRAPHDLLIAVARNATPAHETGTALVTDVDDFLNGTLDEDRIVRLGFALSLCTWGAPRGDDAPSSHPRGLDRAYAVCYLAVRAGRFGPEGTTTGTRLTPQLIPALAAGAVDRAVRLAASRLHADGLRPLAGLAECRRTPGASKRIAAALAFPLASRQRAALEAAALMPSETLEGVAS
jgi:CRISPR-associated protein Csx17